MRRLSHSLGLNSRSTMIHRPGISCLPIRNVQTASPFSSWVRHDALADRHELVERFENADRAGHVTVPDGAFLADVREVSSHAAHSSKPRFTSSRLARRSHTVQSHGSYHQTKGRASSAINAHLSGPRLRHGPRAPGRGDPAAKPPKPAAGLAVPGAHLLSARGAWSREASV